MNYSFNQIIDADLAIDRRKEFLAPLYLRVANFLIDYLSIYCLSTGVGIGVGYLSSVQYLFFNANQFNPFWDFIIFTFTLFIYFSTEYLFNGKSLGKFLTQTTVKHRLEFELSFKTYILRTLWRLVPLELISFLPGVQEHWHDKFSDTYVVFD
jgi:uncharacterized RDD family membrane protein YckC